MKIHTMKTVNPYFALARDIAAKPIVYSKVLIGKIIYTLQDFVGLEKGYCILQIQYIEPNFDMPLEVKEILNQLGYTS